MNSEPAREHRPGEEGQRRARRGQGEAGAEAGNKSGPEEAASAERERGDPLRRRGEGEEGGDEGGKRREQML